MKKWVGIGLVLLCFLSTVLAEEQPDNYNEYDSLRLLFSLESGVEFKVIDNVQKIEFFQADVSFFPRDNGHLQVNQLSTDATPPAEIKQNGDIAFKWKNPAPTELYYKIDADITTKNNLPPITKKIKFPLRNLNETLLEYTKATDFIDITPEMEKDARDIVGGEDDLYVAVFNLAEWTKRNVEYNLTTLTAEVVQKSSWVLKNKKGVCDELTNLFISLARSVGIPARFISGLVYSNVDHAWGAHGWAEVYFEGVGWVPFDVTFGQYGWIDPSHIKLKESLDSGSASAEYTWQATGVQVKTKELKVTAKIKDLGEKQESPLKIHIEPAHAAVQFKSYVPLLVTLENTQDSYISTSVTIRKAPGLTEKNVKEILLKPGETKTVVWVIQIPDGEQNYLYTATLEAATSFGNSASTKVQYGSEFKFFTKEAAESYLAKSTEREVKKTLEGIKITCSTDQTLYYANDTANIECKLINTKKESMDLDVCIQEDCQQKNVPGQEGIVLNFNIPAQMSGRLPVIAENKDAVAYTYVAIATIPIADIYITDIRPDVISYGETTVLKFNLNADTEVHDVTINFGFDKFHVDKFKGTREVTIEAKGKNLRKGLKFNVQFKDEKEKEYSLEKAVYLQVTNIPWYAELVDWLGTVLGLN